MPEVVVAGPSVADALREATSALGESSDTPRLDAELLMAHVLGVDRARLVVDARAAVGVDALARFDALVARRAAHEPVAYILGRKEFRRITLSVDPRVLIPRPETELLVEVGLTLGFGARVVDVGTGSGAVALALKDERPDLEVWGTDVSADALAVARENASRLGLEVSFVRADLLDGLPGRFDAVLANLPYVADGAELPPDVARYEPAGALFAGGDGLDVIRRLLAGVQDVGLIALEVGFDQAEAVAALLAGHAASATEDTASATDDTATATEDTASATEDTASATEDTAPATEDTAPATERTGPATHRTNSVEIVRDLAGHERVVVARR